MPVWCGINLRLDKTFWGFVLDNDFCLCELKVGILTVFYFFSKLLKILTLLVTILSCYFFSNDFDHFDFNDIEDFRPYPFFGTDFDYFHFWVRILTILTFLLRILTILPFLVRTFTILVFLLRILTILPFLERMSTIWSLW